MSTVGDQTAGVQPRVNIRSAGWVKIQSAPTRQRDAASREGVTARRDEDRGKAALTELFNEVKTAETPIMVERVVADIDEIVRLVRFPGWQGTQAGEREVKKALRKALFKYKLHADEELFEKAYSYIRQYY